MSQNLQRSEILLKPLELENGRLRKENNDLHTHIIQEKQLASTVESKYSVLYRQREDQHKEYRFLL